MDFSTSIGIAAEFLEPNLIGSLALCPCQQIRLHTQITGSKSIPSINKKQRTSSVSCRLRHQTKDISGTNPATHKKADLADFNMAPELVKRYNPREGLITRSWRNRGIPRSERDIRHTRKKGLISPIFTPYHGPHERQCSQFMSVSRRLRGGRGPRMCG